MGSASIPAIDRLWEGRTIDGKFALLEWLGGCADQGVFVTLGAGARRAAIKLIVAEDADADAWLSQWELARRLSHPHLMPVLDTGHFASDGTPMVYVLSECGERVLAQFIQDRPLKLHETTNILSPLVDVLAYLHAKGFVHGHVKPSNVFVSADQLKLSSDNFLLAASVPTRLVRPGPYDAPELASGNFSPAADVWSLGMTLAEALTQQKLVWDPSSGRPPEIPQSLPLPFAEIVPECLRLDPLARCTLADIKPQLVETPAPPPFPTPDELVARMKQQQAPYRLASQPAAASAPEPVSSRPAGKWKSDETDVHTTTSRGLFASIEEESRKRRSKVPFVLGLVFLLAVIAFVLLQARVANLSLAHLMQSVSGPTPTAPQPSAATPSQPLSTAGSEAVSPVTPSAAQAETNPAAAAPTAPSSPPSEGTPSSAPPAVEQPGAPQSAAQQEPPAAPSSATRPVASGEAAAAPATPAESEPKVTPRPRNAAGAVDHRVMPAVSPEASASMRAPLVVILRVTVNRSGSVADASYVSPGAGNYFARVAQRAALQWTFDPPLQGGRPQASVWRLRFYFTRGAIDVSESEER